MIVLGHTEPSLQSSTREIRQQDFSLVELLTQDQWSNVQITIPSTSVLVTIGSSPTRVGMMSIYYECDPQEESTDAVVALHALTVGGTVPERGRLLGHFWHGGKLIALYFVPVTS